MKREEQELINNKIRVILDSAIFFTSDISYAPTIIHLRHCSADVIIYNRFIALKSYNTIVAYYDMVRNILIDILRLEYKYTATSAQHIAKFKHDYCNSDTVCLRWYDT